jgi:hypothetical protein
MYRHHWSKTNCVNRGYDTLLTSTLTLWPLHLRGLDARRPESLSSEVLIDSILWHSNQESYRYLCITGDMNMRRTEGKNIFPMVHTIFYFLVCI